MEEIKRMLEAIHRENKTIIKFLCSVFDEDKSEEYLKSIVKDVDDRYDGLFYGKDDVNERIKD